MHLSTVTSSADRPIYRDEDSTERRWCLSDMKVLNTMGLYT